MKGQDMFLGLNYINTKYVEEAETVRQFREEGRTVLIRRCLLIGAVLVTIAAAVLICAFGL